VAAPDWDVDQALAGCLQTLAEALDEPSGSYPFFVSVLI
jgi:hypothetical protein